MTNEANTYLLLSTADAAAVRRQLEAAHRYFYHFTIDTYLDSIAATGLNPCLEGEASRYADRKREPPNAMRFCIQSELALGFSAANTRNQYWDGNAFLWLPKPSKVVLVRTPAASLLSRSFGLDHSFSNADSEVSRILGDLRQQLTPDEFIRTVVKFGAISCYDLIPAAELEVCRDPQEFCKSGNGVFSPLAK